MTKQDLSDLVSQVTDEHQEHLEAKEGERQAEVDLLVWVVDQIRPALSALSSLLPGIALGDGLCRGVLLYQRTPGTDCLVLLEDGTFAATSQQGHVTYRLPRDPAEVLRSGWSAGRIMLCLVDALEKQARGRKTDVTEAILERTERLRALATLVNK
jgi:hypothetical protein